jgi:hypothetical protein
LGAFDLACQNSAQISLDAGYDLRFVGTVFRELMLIRSIVVARGKLLL